MQFKIEQFAIHANPAHRERAMALLIALGLTEWTEDRVTAEGSVLGVKGERNQARLSFNYQASTEPVELEVLTYTDGAHWHDEDEYGVRASHLGMHVTEDELTQWEAVLYGLGITVAQAVETTEHTNPAIAGKRRYRYVIFDTRHLIGVDLKFIVRLADIG